MSEAANRIQELEAALAQKTRECDETYEKLYMEQILREGAEDRAKEYAVQVEQLGRQVADLSKPVTPMEWSQHCPRKCRRPCASGKRHSSG